MLEVKEFIDDRDTNYSEFLIARQNEDIVGFIAIKKVFDELEIVNIVTRADKRQQGIGSNLLSYIIRKYADVRKINLEVGEHNIVAALCRKGCDHPCQYVTAAAGRHAAVSVSV